MQNPLKKNFFGGFYYLYTSMGGVDARILISAFSTIEWFGDAGSLIFSKISSAALFPIWYRGGSTVVSLG